MPKHKTQRQYAEEGKARERAAFRVKFMKQYDTDPRQAAGFVAALMRPKTRNGIDTTDLDKAALLEDFIRENGLNGELLREAFSNYCIA